MSHAREPGDPETIGPRIPRISTQQMIEVDRAMIEDLGIELLQMMEHAGRHLAHLARDRFLDGDPRGRRVVVLAGSGGNGGGALVAARRLHGWGARVVVCTSRPAASFAGVPAHQLRIVQRLGIGVGEGLPAIGDGARREEGGTTMDDPAPDDHNDPPAVILDGLIGYSLSGDPRGPASALIEWANCSAAPTLSLDVPSGMDAGTGRVYEPCVRAEATLTLALPKTGLDEPAAAEHVGELYLADIGVPPRVYAAMGLQVGPIFWEQEVLRLR